MHNNRGLAYKLPTPLASYAVPNPILPSDAEIKIVARGKYAMAPKTLAPGPLDIFITFDGKVLSKYMALCYKWTMHY